MRRSLAATACLLLAAVSAPLLAAATASADTAFQFAVPGARFPDDPDVSGIRLSLLHGRNQSTRGIDFGLLSMSETTTMSGISFIGGVHRLHGDMSGGATFNVVNVHEGRDRGFNGAFVNLLTQPDGAFTVGFLNVARGATLVDLGGINVSEGSVVQIGFLNVTSRLRAFQFGFLNLAENGFVPVFPVFNFPIHRGASDRSSE